MDESAASAALAAWIDTSLGKVLSDLARARSLLGDATGRVLTTFQKLREQLAREHTLYRFEDMLTQLLCSIGEKLEVVRSACRAGAAAKLAELDRVVNRDTVTQQSLGAGAVELFDDA